MGNVDKMWDKVYQMWDKTRPNVGQIVGHIKGQKTWNKIKDKTKQSLKEKTLSAKKLITNINNDKIEMTRVKTFFVN